MKKNFFNYFQTSIQAKLVAMMMFVGIFFILINGTGYLIYHYLNIKKELIREYSILSDILLSNLESSLTFDDSQAANQILSTLEKNPDVLAVQVFRQDETFFAQYQVPDENILVPLDLKLNIPYFKDETFFLKKEVFLKNQQIDASLGYVYFIVDLKRIINKEIHSIQIAFIATMCSLIVAFFLSQKLQKYISQPILMLSQSMSQIAKEQNYHYRHPKTSQDEIGQLVDAYNLMLEKIDSQKNKLKLHAENLEELVHSRTQELAQSNAELTNALNLMQEMNLDMENKILEISQLNDNLKQTQDQLLQSQKLDSIGKLAGGVAHDFNNILASILGYASLLKNKFKDDDRIFKQLTTIEKSAERGAQLTNQLLGFARKGQYEKIQINLNDTIYEAKNLLERSLGKDINIELHLEQYLPYIEGDSTQIFQIFMNLGVNARDAMPHGGVICYKNSVVQLSMDNQLLLPSGSYILVEVSDTGKGMSSEVQKQIFDPFFTTKKLGEGTGLGLSMVYGIMDSHHGKILVESEINKGTTFKLYFPIAKTYKEIHQSMNSAQNFETLKILNNKNVLIVEDEAAIRSMMVDFLKENNANIFEAKDGVEAENIIHKQLLDLIILDILMPNKNGIEVYKDTQHLLNQTKILFMSGFSEDEQLKKFRQSQDVFFLKKPFKQSDLIQTINFLLQ